MRPGERDEDRMDRSRRIDWVDVEAIRGTRCLVVGAGALGNEAVKDLVLSGFRDIVLVDMDHIVLSNLNRCLFFHPSDVSGEVKKAEVVARRAGELDPDVTIEPRVCRIEELDDDEWRGFDLALGCLDNIAARLHVNSYARHFRVPYIDGGTEGMRGKVQVVLPNGPCLQCNMNRSHQKVLEKRYSCTGREVTFFERSMAAEITTTAVVAAIQVREALKIASGIEDRCISNVLYYDGLSGRTDELEVSVDPSCPNHVT